MKIFNKKENRYQEYLKLYEQIENKLEETREFFIIIKNNKEEYNLDEINNALNNIEESLNQKAYKLLSKGKPEEQLENLDKQYLLADMIPIVENKWGNMRKTSENSNFYSYIDGELYENLEPIFDTVFNKDLSSQVNYQANNQKRNDKRKYEEIREDLIKNAFGYNKNSSNFENYNPRYYVEIPQEILNNYKKKLKALELLLEDDKYLNDMIEALKDMSNKLKLLFEDLEMLNKTDELEDIDKEGILLQELAQSTIIKD